MGNIDRTAITHRGNNEYLYDSNGDGNLFKGKGNARAQERERGRERIREGDYIRTHPFGKHYIIHVKVPTSMA